MVRDHQSYFGEDIQNLGEACAQGLSLAGAGTSEQISVFDNYIDRLQQNIDFGDFSVVWDAETELLVQPLTLLLPVFPEHKNAVYRCRWRVPQPSP